MNEQQIRNVLSFAAALIGVGPDSDRSRYLEMTEGRDDWIDANGVKRNYAWCGDYITYVLARSGVRDGTLLNREEVNGRWLPGANITLIQSWAQKRGVWRTDFGNMTDGSVFVQIREAGDHIGFVQNAALLTPSTLDGNSWGGVVASNQKSLSRSNCRGYLRLEDVPAMEITPPGSYGLPLPAPIPLPFELPLAVIGDYEEAVAALSQTIDSILPLTRGGL